MQIIDERIDRLSWESLYLTHSFNMLIAGPNSSGKTKFVKRILEYRHLIMHPPPQKIVRCYKEWQPTYSESCKSEGYAITFIEGIPTSDEELFSDTSYPHLLVFDDLMEKGGEHIKSWFTRKGHHRNTSVVYITQNLDQQSKEHRTIILNRHYLVLFKYPRDKSRARVLASKLGTL